MPCRDRVTRESYWSPRPRISSRIRDGNVLENPLTRECEGCNSLLLADTLQLFDRRTFLRHCQPNA